MDNIFLLVLFCTIAVVIIVTLVNLEKNKQSQELSKIISNITEELEQHLSRLDLEITKEYHEELKNNSKNRLLVDHIYLLRRSELTTAYCCISTGLYEVSRRFFKIPLSKNEKNNITIEKTMRQFTDRKRFQIDDTKLPESEITNS